MWRGAGVRPPPRPRTPSQRECVFMIAHGRRNTGPRAPEGSYLNFSVRFGEQPPLHIQVVRSTPTP